MPAQRVFLRSLHREFGDRRIGESSFDHGRGLVKPSMERTQLASVSSSAQRAVIDPLNAIHGVYNIEDGDLGGIAAQDESAASPRSRLNQISAGHFLKYLGHVPHRYLGRLGDLACADGGVWPTGDPNDRPQCIFRGQRNHPDSRFGRTAGFIPPTQSGIIMAAIVNINIDVQVNISPGQGATPEGAAAALTSPLL